jgi:hypothetical protein
MVPSKQSEGSVGDVRGASVCCETAGGGTVSFIYSFPGEDERPVRARRALMADLNERDWDKPTVFVHIIHPFHYMDFASV